MADEPEIPHPEPTDEATPPDVPVEADAPPPVDAAAPGELAQAEPPKPPDYDAEIAAIVAELMDERVRKKEREAAEAAARRARLLRRGLPLPVQIAIIAVVSALVVWPPAGFLPQPVVPVYTMMQGARVQMWLIANDIERFRRTSGRLPTGLGEIGRDGHDVMYERAGTSQYTLSSQSPVFQWRSDEPMTRILSGVPNSLVPQRAR